ncbi:mandelate racemase/muconate lactonizing enzyme [Amycolatopsis mediterranei S699]|uniref:Mandelate racemase/muconate lactonizing enzyme n=2 Tax=Amycolatopsis mediterranei TaxID=33910 RepID=A0A0H3D868_AMYMU|nr:enolase C-terminal domain-like protein [Amycolatopsis mediterranei]ADJ46836.1 mandelate racemase/muconate lactonizing enzyme [Amycolatopsis mediterranei U32]AEK43643.1 mandelate racemase/muconate lactonizing enzyme [Amycolatopsis mediterranei S699]AFO78547.1 mandelate racemase/muconate lactonizing enzyme [Amycolatopsis mediterranei S699]AGT85675.1 mandelate racemase/muconate lactonizing enzyme [Amycolatopsis mediterranei RB]KDO04731.1 mandelate racemase [Amycolatopsis mediterranei]
MIADGRTLTGLTIDRVETFAVALPTVRSFGVSGGSIAVAGQPSLRILVKVSADGVAGWGEATPIPAWTYETAESIVTTIDRYLAPAILGRPCWDLRGVNNAFDHAINRGFSIGAPLAKSAVDVALHDLLGHALGVPVGVLWGRRRREIIELGWVVSGQTEAEVAACVAEGRALGYRAFKVKVGLHTALEDLAVVRAVRAASGAAPLWVDANQAYTVDTALWLARRLVELDVTAFEQPLPANDIVGLRRLRDVSPIPVALDESLRHPNDLATFVRLDAVAVAIAKVQRSGGLTLSRRLCVLAEDSGVRLMGSGLTDSDLGLAASLHLFAAHGIDTPVDLNGRQFIGSVYTTGTTVVVSDGVAQVPTGPGLGVEVDEAAVRELAVDVL